MHILFVCTGNVCRSPMAEGIARDRYGHLATFASAGTYAVAGAAPTEAATVAAGEVGAEISGLRGLSLAGATNPRPDRIYVMTKRQRDKVSAALPALAGRVELLDPAREVPDPYGLDIDVYRRTRDQIAAAIDARAGEWLADGS